MRTNYSGLRRPISSSVAPRTRSDRTEREHREERERDLQASRDWDTRVATRALYDILYVKRAKKAREIAKKALREMDFR